MAVRCERLAEECLGRAGELDEVFPDLAKVHREAAHRQAESAACLRGEREGATVEDLGTAEEMEVKTSPTTGLRAAGRIIHHLAQRQAQSEGLAYTLTVWPGSPRKGDIVFTDVVDALRELLRPTPSMTLERACEVLKSNRHSESEDWKPYRYPRRTMIGSCFSGCLLTEFEAVAIAERYLRDAAAAPAKEVG